MAGDETAGRFGCIEAGGTKFVLAVIDGDGRLIEETRIPTRAPQETLGAMTRWFQGRGELSAFGVATFGPADVDPSSPTWGRITETVKPGWDHADVAGALIGAYGRPVGFDTDVTGAAMAEAEWGAAKSDGSCVYVTVGTGIGGGAVSEGRPLHGYPHPEMGHMLPRRHDGDDFAGCCPFHVDCLEGLASGTAITARWGKPLSDLPQDHSGREQIADYLGQMAVAIQAMIAPRRIIMGGGVMATPGLREQVQAQATQRAAGYFHPRIVAPGLGDRAGIMGALLLAKQAAASG